MNTRPHARRARLLAPVASLAVLLLWSSIVMAQSRTASPVGGFDLGTNLAPRTSTPMEPVDTLLIGDIPTSSVTLKWSQLPIVKPGAGTSVAPVTFHPCFWVSGTPHDCRARTGLVAILDVPASAVTRTIVDPLRGWEIFTRKRVPRVDYQYVASLPSSVLDHDLEWTVMTCGRPPKQGCTVGTSRHLSLTARDLAVHDLNGRAGTNDVMIPLVKVRNDGRTQGGTFELHTKMWEVIPDPVRTRSLKDINDPAVRSTDQVVTRQGTLVLVADYRAQGLPADDIVGFHRSGFALAEWRRRAVDEPPPVPAGTALQPGTCTAAGADCDAQVTEVFPCDEGVPCSLHPNQPLPAAFVLFSVVNPGLAWEFEREDNALAKGNLGLR